MTTARVRFFALAAAVAASFSIAGQVLADPAIVNGSFESPAETPNSLTEITATGVPGWTGSSIGGAAHEYIINGNIQDTQGRNYGSPAFGAQYLSLNPVANHSFRSIESQTVDGFIAGQTYALTVYYANLDGITDAKISVVATDGSNGSGTVLNSQVFTAPKEGPYGSATIDFLPAVLDFTALTTGTVTFSIGNQSSTGTMGIDNVSLAAVPEPATVLGGVLTAALLGLGLGRRLRAC